MFLGHVMCAQATRIIRIAAMAKLISCLAGIDDGAGQLRTAKP